jgi:DNA-binding response OmpR family regulator
VADEDEDIRHIVAGALVADGYDVVQVSDGGRLLVALAREFAAKSARDRVDLLILDIQSPDCAEMPLLKQIRAEGGVYQSFGCPC